jgi:hypothetical protein
MEWLGSFLERKWESYGWVVFWKGNGSISSAIVVSIYYIVIHECNREFSLCLCYFHSNTIQQFSSSLLVEILSHSHRTM